jgi:hypothetical protein
MPQFRFTIQGEPTGGTIEAASTAEAVRELRKSRRHEPHICLLHLLKPGPVSESSAGRREFHEYVAELSPDRIVVTLGRKYGHALAMSAAIGVLLVGFALVIAETVIIFGSLLAAVVAAGVFFRVRVELHPGGCRYDRRFLGVFNRRDQDFASLGVRVTTDANEQGATHALRLTRDGEPVNWSLDSGDPEALRELARLLHDHLGYELDHAQDGNPSRQIDAAEAPTAS